MKGKKVWYWRRNGQLYDLGFDHKYDNNKSAILRKIGQLSREIDLMIINEYFDEALILLKKLMCWDYEDILYISKGMRSSTHRFNISNVVADKGDVMLYDHFNGTFWTKIQEYGSSLERSRSLSGSATIFFQLLRKSGRKIQKRQKS